MRVRRGATAKLVPFVGMRLGLLVVFVALVLVACGGGESDPAANEEDAGSARDGGARTDGGAPRDDGSGAGGNGGGSGTMSTGGASARGGSGAGGSSGSSAMSGSGATSGGGAASGGGTAASSGSQGRACLPAGAYCTWSNAEDCCSGACDGDSCCGFLGDACMNGFGCCEGSCIGGTCKCPEGTLDCGSGCVDIEWNENRCGDCDTQCGTNSLCEAGQCICDPNLFDAQFYVQCPDGCFNTRSDDQHCGNCTTSCTGGTECAGGSCKCPFGTEDCGSGCEDLSSNPLRCGSCTNACDAATEDCVSRQCQCKPGLFACTPGVCVDRMTDENNCGSCDMVCMGNKTCQGGKCVN